jgi:hypothetical protein
MTDRTDVVWVSAHASSVTPKRYHTDADCPYLHKSGDSPTAKSLSLIDSHYEHCQWCAGEMDSDEGSDPREYTSILASADPDDIGQPMTDGGQDRVPVCPECGSVSVREKLSDPRNDSRESAADWYCHKCTSHFETPDEQPRSETDARPDNPGSSDLVQRLLDADADEVGQPMTDGGEQIGVEAPSLEEVAADRLPDTTAESCAYETCDSQADFMVLTRQTGGATATFATCHDCQQRACLHLVANEIVENDISEWRRQLRDGADDKGASADD